MIPFRMKSTRTYAIFLEKEIGGGERTIAVTRLSLAPVSPYHSDVYPALSTACRRLCRCVIFKFMLVREVAEKSISLIILFSTQGNIVLHRWILALD